MMPEAAIEQFLSPCLHQFRSTRFPHRLLRASAILAALFFSMLFARGADTNALVLAQVRSMPQGGNYAASRLAMERFTSAVGVKNGALAVQASGAVPNFCSEATYLIFLKVVAAESDALQLPPETRDALLVRGQTDGHGVWGRWNANGPGTARLFHELGLGRNFEDFDQARPGDFMKIFWSQEVGSREHGHSVIFLGREQHNGEEIVRFWSSNMPGGYGEKAVPRSKIKFAVFSRLEHPEALARVPALPAADPYLSRMNTTRSSIPEVRAMAGM